jgi:lysozyme
MTNLIKGLDVSIVQGNVDFNAIKAAGIQFVMLRCYVGNSGGDADYAKYLQEATAAGLYVGSYNFPFPLPGTGNRTPQWQAETHFNATKTQVAACDAEWPTSDTWAKWGCSAQQINDWFLAYLDRYTQLAGKAPLVYTYPNFAQTVNFSSDWGNYDLWIASYQATPYIPKPWINKGWRMWQVTGGGGQLPGSGVPVDTDCVKDLSLFGITDQSNNNAATTPEVTTVSSPTPPPVVVVSVPLASPVAPSVALPAANTNFFSTLIATIISWFKK